MYLTYEEYQEYGGTLDETTFFDFEFEAATVINWYTFNRLRNDEGFPEEVKRCAYRLIQLAKLKADALALGNQTTTVKDENGHVIKTIETSSAIASQSNDGVSISYNTVSAAEVFSKISANGKGNELEATVTRYLQGVTNSLGQHVLYRGIYPNEPGNVASSQKRKRKLLYRVVEEDASHRGAYPDE